MKKVGFEPTMRKLNRFTICRFKPLSHFFLFLKFLPTYFWFSASIMGVETKTTNSSDVKLGF